MHGAKSWGERFMLPKKEVVLWEKKKKKKEKQGDRLVSGLAG